MNNTSTPVRYLRPAASIVENADGFIIEADLPGVTREGLELTVDQDSLTIVGKRNQAPLGGRNLHRESTACDYRRAFELGREIDRQRVEARLEQGVLRVFLPKVEAIKPRRVEIAS
jgi:HSP20 family molecular chaperone IbpA